MVIFRLAVFDAPLPNTYYLKLGGVPLDLRLERGLAKAAVSLRENLLPVLAVVAAVVSGIWRGVRRRVPTPVPAPLGWLRRGLADPVALPALLLLSYAGYSVWVGGDAWELPRINIGLNRFVVFLVPLAAVLVNNLWNRLNPRGQRAHWGWWTAAATLVALVLANGLLLSPRRADNMRKVTLEDRPALVESTVLVYVNLRKLQRRLAPGAKVVTYWAGVPAYFSDYELVDGLGYADPHVARRPLPPEIDAGNYVPGHHKSDPAYLLAQQPDAFFQLWDIDRLPVRWPRHHLRDLGYVQAGEFWLHRDSPYLLPGALDPPPAPGPG